MMIFDFLYQLLNVIRVLLFVRILLSWVMPQANWYNQPLKTLYMITEPIMAPFRRLIPPISGIDFSPIVLFLVIQVLMGLLRSMSSGPMTLY